MPSKSLLPLVALILCSCSHIGASPKGTDDHQLKVGTLTRTYSLHIPTFPPDGKAVPLVIVLHGSGDSGRGIEDMTQFSPLSDREGFIVAYPDALDENWNDGREAADIDSQFHHVDDVGFLSALIDDISKGHRIDPKRIFVTGFSNGGILADYAGAQLADRLAAVAPVSGGIAEPFAAHFKPSGPISVLIIHGDSDKLVPYEGGNVDYKDNGRIIATQDTVERWRRVCGCQAEPAVGDLPDTDTHDHCKVKWSRWSGGRQGTEVMTFIVTGGGHGWPGGPQFLPPSAIGYVNHDFDATSAIWEFFKKHPRA